MYKWPFPHITVLATPGRSVHRREKLDKVYAGEQCHWTYIY
jgi:hypothetical protein